MTSNYFRSDTIVTLFRHFFKSANFGIGVARQNMRMQNTPVQRGSLEVGDMSAPVNLSAAGLLLKDYEEIETALLGARAWEDSRRLAKIHPIAPPQGSPWLHRRILTVRQSLGRFSPLYR